MPGFEIERIDPLSGACWDERVTACHGHSVFHRSAWAGVLAETYGHRPHYLAIRHGGDETALVPLMEVRSPVTGRRGVSLPFSDFAGPLWNQPELGGDVHETLSKLAADLGWKHLEIRGGGVAPENAKPFRSYAAHQLDLRGGIETVEKNLCPAVRRSLRKAERSGLTVTVENGPEALGVYYQLHGRTRRRHGLPPQPYRFFQSFWKHLISRGLGEIVLARLGRLAVAGAVFLRSGVRAIYKFGASDTSHWPLRPNQLIMWAGIRHLIAAGCEWLHFGRTAEDDKSLARFKLSWGCVEERLHYHRYRPATRSWLVSSGPRAEGHPLFFGHLPISLNRLAGRLIYPHLD